MEELENSVVDTLFPYQPDDDDATSSQAVSILSCITLSTFTYTTKSKFLDAHDPPTSLGLQFHAPAHAFPSVYPPVCSYDPFPDSPERRALELPWIRTRISSPPIRQTIDVSDLTSLFAQLTLGDEPPHVLSTMLPVSSSHLFIHRPSWLHSGFVTPCARAPLPALVRTSKPGRHVCPAVVPSNASRERQTPIRQGRRTSPFHLQDSSLQAADTAPTRRPKRALPRRFPNNPPSHPPSPPPHSEFSMLSRSSSVSSKASISGSDIDSPPRTPQPLVLILPDISRSLTVRNDSIPLSDALPISSSLELLTGFDGHDIPCHFTAPLPISLPSTCLGFL